jgi:hypothetical protein
MSKHNISCLVGPGAVSIKSVSRHVVLFELVFLHPVGSASHVVPNFYFLHLMGFADHVVHSGASGAQNVDTLFFVLGWAQYGFHIQEMGNLRIVFRICP